MRARRAPSQATPQAMTRPGADAGAADAAVAAAAGPRVATSRPAAKLRLCQQASAAVTSRRLGTTPEATSSRRRCRRRPSRPHRSRALSNPQRPSPQASSQARPKPSRRAGADGARCPSSSRPPSPSRRSRQRRPSVRRQRRGERQRACRRSGDARTEWRDWSRAGGAGRALRTARRSGSRTRRGGAPGTPRGGDLEPRCLRLCRQRRSRPAEERVLDHHPGHRLRLLCLFAVDSDSSAARLERPAALAVRPPPDERTSARQHEHPAQHVPSGHAAEAVACVLLVAAAPWPVLLAVAVAAALVSAGAVLGRYHYAADALVGWIVAVGVWVALR